MSSAPLPPPSGHACREPWPISSPPPLALCVESPADRRARARRLLADAQRDAMRSGRLLDFDALAELGLRGES